jgi:2'-hydroxyisoflavone reductase
VTLFNRGRSNADLFPTTAKIIGDRDGGLDALQGRRWDAVIDSCGYFPRLVRDSATILAGAVDRYVFISTISVYASLAPLNIDENAPLGTLADATVEEITGGSYGPLKVLCEQVVEEIMPGRSLIVRPGLITGPHDHTDRFGYWPYRVDLGGNVLAPGRPQRPIQHIDVRDLATFVVDMTEKRETGIYNTTGPYHALTMGQLLDTCLEIGAHEATVHWVDEQFLLDQKVVPWGELPFWVPEADRDMAGFMRINCQKALDAGLTFRPLLETVRDWLVWHKTRADHEWQQALTPERERAILKAWLQQKNAGGRL